MTFEQLTTPEVAVEQRRARRRTQARVSCLFAVLLATASLSSSKARANQTSAPQPVAEAAASPLQLEYHLRLSQPSTHLAEIEIQAGNVSAATLDFAMPAWSPGRYAIYDFAKNVQEFEATGADGRPLAWSQPDKQTWRVESGGAGEVRVRYKVYGNDLNGSFSQIDSTHANLNGASIFMYVEGHKPDPLHLTVEAPEKWKVVSGYTLATGQRSFEASNYDRLIDTPLEISPTISVDSFTDHGKTFRVAVHDYATAEDERGALISRLVDGVQKIVAVDMAMMPAPDFDHYTFLLHFAPDLSAGDGMEHLNSTQIIVGELLSDSGIEEALFDAAHEFFHVWNVKRLRPIALGPFDYTREDYTRSLWFAEGITSYYGYLAMRRSGLWTKDQFLQHLTSEIQQLENEPGRKLMSAESSSFHAWFYDRSPQMQETNFANSTISYYNKGALLGWLLDLEIRARTGGRKSLDDVMRLMYERFYGAPESSYYLPGRGYEEHDILQALNDVSGSDFGDFWHRAVEGTDPLAYAETLAKFGLTLKTAVEPGAGPSLGVVTRAATTGVQITQVLPGGAADRAGLSRDDLLVAVDNFSLATEPLAERLKIYPPGAEVPFTVQR
ncbi:MAG TPA: PDZ domain-containing protein, partial [Terriglobia bacterium]